MTPNGLEYPRFLLQTVALDDNLNSVPSVAHRLKKPSDRVRSLSLLEVRILMKLMDDESMQEIYVPVFVGLNDHWPHLLSVVESAGFSPI